MQSFFPLKRVDSVAVGIKIIHIYFLCLVLFLFIIFFIRLVKTFGGTPKVLMNSVIIKLDYEMQKWRNAEIKRLSDPSMRNSPQYLPSTYAAAFDSVTGDNGEEMINLVDPSMIEHTAIAPYTAPIMSGFASDTMASYTYFEADREVDVRNFLQGVAFFGAWQIKMVKDTEQFNAIKQGLEDVTRSEAERFTPLGWVKIRSGGHQSKHYGGDLGRVVKMISDQFVVIRVKPRHIT
jgi:hypothetical protein